MTSLLMTVGLLVAIYWISLHLHPYRLCRYCKGSPPRHHGMLFNTNFRPCHHCGGRGRQQRFGAWVLNIGDRREKRSRWAP